MKVLFIGGTGIISSACSRLAIEQGIDLWLLCRGKSPRPEPANANILRADIRDRVGATRALAEHQFDAVVQWIGFTPEHIEVDLALFRERTKQYVFISSASIYEKPPTTPFVTEATRRHNPFWGYSRAKIACEDRLMRAYREERFPMTIVRPSHTYDCTLVPPHGGWTVVERMRRGQKIIVHGDGTSLWTLTHHAEFAKGFIGLLGLEAAIGQAFHITSDELLTWDQIHQTLARAAGTEADIVHVPSDFIAAFDPEWGKSLLGDKAHSMIFDNAKIKRFVSGFRASTPFVRGAEEIVAWYDADPRRRVIDDTYDHTVDAILSAYERARPTH